MIPGVWPVPFVQLLGPQDTVTIDGLLFVEEPGDSSDDYSVSSDDSRYTECEDEDGG